MAGYRITFDGSLSERLDVPQVTAGNSLTNSVTVSPTGNGFEGNSPFTILGTYDLFGATFPVYNA